MASELLYQVSLSLVPTIGPVHAKILIDQYGQASSVFKAPLSALEKTEGIGEIRAKNIKRFRNFNRAEEEIHFMDKYKIRPLFLTDKSYPQRFLHCYDPPTLIYYKGNTDLNHSKMVAIVGTRTNTEYGRQLTEQLVRDLSAVNVVVVSGLAFGIDAIAHKSALKYDVPTIGVVAHGLDTIYPGQHKSLAKSMIAQGGLLTEFTSKTKPDKHNFPIRNRIVAGISEVTIVIETSMKGGSMITAEMANGYNRDVFAVPGKVTDSRSAGCNYLIKTNKAMLLTDAKQLIEIMGWEEKKKKSPNIQREMFIDLNEEEKRIVHILKEKESMAIDELKLKSSLSSSTVAATMLNLEFRGVITALPGKMFRLA
jgi:DNA processing protein